MKTAGNCAEWHNSNLREMVLCGAIRREMGRRWLKNPGPLRATVPPLSPRESLHKHSKEKQNTEDSSTSTSSATRTRSRTRSAVGRVWSQYGIPAPGLPGAHPCDVGKPAGGAGAGGGGGGTGPGVPVQNTILDGSTVLEHSWTAHSQSSTFVHDPASSREHTASPAGIGAPCWPHHGTCPAAKNVTGPPYCAAHP